MQILNTRQERFCQIYAVNEHAADAYMAAGYHVRDKQVAYNSASRLLSNVYVQQRIAELRQVQAKATIMNREERLEWLTKIVRGETDDINGPASLAVKQKAADMLNKMCGDYTETIEHRGGMDIVVTLERDEDE